MPKCEKGAITIFCIIVLFSIVLLGGVFIDGSRILLARQVLRSSMNSAARSALSYYDTGMVGDFGLYGVSEEDAKTQFERYLKNNLTLSRNDGFNLYRFELGETPVSVTVSDPLNNPDVFVDQVSEYAKYRSGINLTIGVVEKVKMIFGGENSPGNKVFGAADDSKKAVDDLKREAKSFSTRVNAKLQSAVDTNAKKAKETLRDCIKTNQPLEFGETALLESVTLAGGEIAGMEQTKQDYLGEAQKANQTMNNAENALSSVEYWNEETKTWVTDSSEAVGTNAPPPANTPDQQAQTLIDAAKTDMEQTQSRITQNINAAKDKANQAQTIQSEITQLEKELEELMKPQTTLKKNRDDAQKALEDFQAEHDLDADLSLDEKRKNLSALQEGGTGADSQQNPERQQVLSKEIELIEESEEARKNYESSISQYVGKTTELNGKKKNLERLLDEIDALYDGMPSHTRLPDEISYDLAISEQDQSESDAGFDKVWKKLEEIYNSTVGELSKVDYTIDQSGESAFARPETGSNFGFDKLFGLVGSISSIFQDPNILLENAYLVDYAVDKYTFLTSQSSRPSHHFQLGEVEYILKGKTVQGANLGGVMLDVALLRAVINFVDDLIHTHSPEPISRIVVALGRALIHTAGDMYDMLFREGCSLCPSFKNVKLTYSDHLRLKLLLEVFSSRSAMIENMITMIDRTMDVKGSKHADSLYTRIEATAEVKIDLVMVTLPMFGSLMPGQDVIKDGTFLLRETVSMGY